MRAPSGEGLFARMQLGHLADKKWELLRAEASTGAYAMAHLVWWAAIECSMLSQHQPVPYADIAAAAHVTAAGARDAIALLARFGLAVIHTPGKPKPNLVEIPNVDRHQVKLRKSFKTNDATTSFNHATTSLTPTDVPEGPISESQEASNHAVASFNHVATSFNHVVASLPHPIEARAERLERDGERRRGDTHSRTADEEPPGDLEPVCSEMNIGAVVIPISRALPCEQPAEPIPGAADAAGEVPPGLSSPLASPAAQDHSQTLDDADLPPVTAAATSVPFSGLLKARMKGGVLGGLNEVFGKAFEHATRAHGVPNRAVHGIDAIELIATLPLLILPEVTEASWNPMTHGVAFTRASFDAATAFCESPWIAEAPLQRMTWRFYLTKAYTLFAFEASPEIIELKKRISTASDDTLKATLLDTLKAKRYGVSPHGGAPQGRHPATPHRARIEPLERDAYFQEGFTKS